MEYKYRSLKKADRQGLIDLLTSCFEFTSDDKGSVIDWKYFNNNEVISRVALDKSGKLVSFYCNKRIELISDDEVYKTGLCLDMATMEEHRGKGLISVLSRQVYEKVKKKKFDLSIGFSNESGIKVDKYSQSYGYKIVGKFKQYYKPVIRSKTSKYLLSDSREFKKAVSIGEFIQLNLSKDYLNWRYINMPEKNYEMLTAKKDGSNIAQLIVRKKGYKLEVLKIIKLDDFSIDLLLKAVNNYAIDKGAKIVVVSLLEKSIWDEILFSNHYLKLPHRKRYYLTVKLHNQDLDPGKFLDPSNWLLMGGDIL